MKPVCLNLENVNGLGDLICATPTIRVLAKSYQQKITVVSKMPELFKEFVWVEASYKSTSIDWDYFKENYIIHNSFYNVGQKNEKGVELHHNRIDIRQFHAINLGFMLTKDEMECFYRPTEPLKHQVPDKYILIHPVQTWEVRTWSAINWMNLAQRLNDLGYNVISIGKDSSETGFFNVQKPVFNFEIEKGLNLMNKTSISDCWHLIDNSICFVTMDSGLLHLAGTTHAPIIHLGSSINPEFRAPYRTSSQDWKYHYVRGGCDLECASNMKYAMDYWDDINSIPPLIKCLEKKSTYECHPNVNQVLEKILLYAKK
jgi:ADP-heptose:LPS heptosyltransferase